MGNLSDRELKSKGKDGRYADGNNLYFVRRGKSTTWSLRWMKAGKCHEFSLGPYPEVTLAKARSQALKLNEAIVEGRNPIADRKSERDQRAYTFKVVAEEYISANRSKWGNPKHSEQWKSTLETYAYPTLGETSVKDITTANVIDVLKPIWETKTETATRVRGRIESILNFAKAKNWREGENPAAWRGHLQNVFPARSKVAPVEHHAAVPWAALPSVFARLAESKSVSGLCVRFIALCAVRSGEARGARWNEFDLENRLWTIPSTRMKGQKGQKKPHRVPLSDAAMAILEVAASLKKDSDSLVFPGGRAGKQLSDVALTKLLQKHFPASTVHGMRSSFRDWCADNQICPREVAEAALAHVNKNVTEAAYFRSDLLEIRRGLMESWAKFVSSST